VSLRPRTARWFEVLAPSDALAATAEALARSGAAHVEAPPAARDEPPLEGLSDLGPLLDACDELVRRYGPYLSGTEGLPSRAGSPRRLLVGAVERLTAWAREADAVIVELERLRREAANLRLCRELFLAAGARAYVPRAGSAGSTLSHRALALALPVVDLPATDGVILQRIDGPEHVFVVVVGRPHDVEHAVMTFATLEPAEVDIPHDPRVDERLASIAREIDASQRAIEALRLRHETGRALADIRRLRWFARSVPAFPHTTHFSLLTGWSDDASGARLRAALAESGVVALLHFPDPPEGVEAPIVLHNPRWARPFERLALLLGTPGRHEIDPTVVLAFVAPILFGYMFGDLGQGLLLFGAGLALRRRVPALALLVPAGLAAMAFGIAFGSVFAREDVLPALWTRPLASPIPVLAGSLVTGAVVLLLGVLLAAQAAIFRGRFPARELSLALVYLGVIGLAVHRAAALGVLAGLLLEAAAGALLSPSRRAIAAVERVGELVEQALQLLVNTLSFARVGAFALAHAGLSSAILTLSHSTSGPAARVGLLIAGNLVIVALEGLVVSIQTTRLVLFEFFARFLRGEGRVYRPLTPPSPLEA
jgi:V/A-type H+-transporting ATPase subunit I